jgi:hypothetical protein
MARKKLSDKHIHPMSVLLTLFLFGSILLFVIYRLYDTNDSLYSSAKGNGVICTVGVNKTSRIYCKNQEVDSIRPIPNSVEGYKCIFVRYVKNDKSSKSAVCNAKNVYVGQHETTNANPGPKYCVGGPAEILLKNLPPGSKSANKIEGSRICYEDNNNNGALDRDERSSKYQRQYCPDDKKMYIEERNDVYCSSTNPFIARVPFCPEDIAKKRQIPYANLKNSSNWEDCYTQTTYGSNYYNYKLVYYCPEKYRPTYSGTFNNIIGFQCLDESPISH